MAKTNIIFILFILLLAATAYATRQHPEKYYQKQWCKEQNGRNEVILPDSTRCDCLTGTLAVEFDFGDKWAEAIGQALYYSLQTGKKAGVVLILEDKNDYKYWIRLNSTIDHFDLPIDAWIMRPE